MITMVPLISVMYLLVVYQLKHFLADYPLQTGYMLGKFKEHGWVEPLAAHAGVHAFFTLGIGLFLVHWLPLWAIFAAAAFDFVIHFTMDRIKASPHMMGRWKSLTGEQYVAFTRVVAGDPTGAPMPVDAAKERLRGNKLFWWALGFDQMVHHLTHYVIIAFYFLLLTH